MSDSRILEEQADRAASAGQFAAARALLEQAVETDSGSPGIWMKLSAMCKASGDLEGALGAVDRALTISQADIPALLARAVILDGLGDANAGNAYQHALAQIPSGQAIPAGLQGAVAHARRRSEEYRKTLEQYLAHNLPADLTSAERSRADRFITNHSRTTTPYHQRPSDFHFPGLPEVEFHDREQFPGLHLLKQASDAIRAEFGALIAAEAAEMVPYVQFPDRVPLRQWKELNNNPKWTAIHLLQNGWPVEVNARHCPRTMEAISKMDQPQVPGASPVAMFSLLAPRTHIPAHSGATNTRLVCHLPLIVPPNCRFRVGATTREWRVGEAFVFDDTIEHEAWNDSDELRVVLIFDVWPPALGPGDRRTAAAVIGATNANFVASRQGRSQE
ncbi:MAG TPA: aspartyl/asparaginyl beta-hydroxylase domain-containing protein [Sphingomicrobium sp.]|nr:aspartyl/asparaginyl beta-hydroxylase domain-containing protein [Sphingomicrobium sp.]